MNRTPSAGPTYRAADRALLAPTGESIVGIATLQQGQDVPVSRVHPMSVRWQVERSSGSLMHGVPSFVPYRSDHRHRPRVNPTLGYFGTSRLFRVRIEFTNNMAAFSIRCPSRVRRYLSLISKVCPPRIRRGLPAQVLARSGADAHVIVRNL